MGDSQHLVGASIDASVAKAFSYQLLARRPYAHAVDESALPMMAGFRQKTFCTRAVNGLKLPTSQQMSTGLN